MAKRTVTVTTDDIDGSEASQSVEFSYRGKSYEIDLNDEHAEEFDEIMAPYIKAAESSRSGSRSSEARGGRRSSSSSSHSDVDPKQVRAWAEANGVAVSPRGRISASVIEQYRQSGA